MSTKTEVTENKTLFRMIALNPAQFAMVQSIIAFHNGETKLTAKQILECNETLRPGKTCMPHFIYRNLVCRRAHAPGIFDLSGLKAASGKSVAAATPKKEKKAKAKKESKAKRGQKIVQPENVIDVPEVVNAEVPEIA